ncbi:hypothetical protein B566_EDAN003109 [Ephemera danica]|nr:hypothetical protein B566_EDAN003109 [Ephemera danica]
MGKKAKIGKHRKDKFYQLAKETGFRSRAAFKLIQLNRKFGFLQKSRVLVDLCAAPGGWMQVAKQNMPVSSVVVGVDLFPIKPIPGCISITEDITTDTCKKSIQKELKTWKADVVLHDGAPNVGKNWLHDAHHQSLLTLSAAKMASQFLRSGGWFISKVFRSKDYNALIWVLKQIFKKVHSTKPQASRTESAEIFVVCQGYLAPDKLDPKFFEPKHVFEELELEPKSMNSVYHPEKQKKAKAEGYPTGVSTMYRAIPASQLIAVEDPVELLQQATQIVIDNDEIAKHPKTTDEMRECLKDVKVLGRKDLRRVMAWCAAVKASLTPPEPAPKVEEGVKDEEEDEDAQIAKQLEEMKDAERRELKRKKKTILKERRKLQERLNLKMIVKGDDGPKLTEGDEMFALKSVTSQKMMQRLEDQSPDEIVGEDEQDEDDEPKKKREAYVPENSRLDKSGTSGPKDKDTATHSEGTALDAFKELETEADEDLELDALAQELKSKGGKIIGDESKEEMNGEDSDDDESDEDSASDYEMPLPPSKSNNKRSSNKAGFEVVSKDAPTGVKRVKLDINGLALGAMVATSRKNRRDFEDAGWHRNAFNDTNLPDWFVEDEKKHCRKELPVSKEMVDELKQRTQELNARPIKKVIEARARKKKRAVRRMERAKKKVEALMENTDVSEQEKARQIKKMYKKAAGGKKPEVAYVVSKKHTTAKRARRPPGVKGPYKVVDPRMKKDTRGAMKAKGGKQGKGGKGKKPRQGKKAGGGKPRQKQNAGGKKRGKK